MVKVAFPTDDGTTLSSHLGQARFYMVVTLEDGAPPKMEQRPKSFHAPHDHPTAPAKPGADLQPISMDAI